MNKWAEHIEKYRCGISGGWRFASHLSAVGADLPPIFDELKKAEERGVSIEPVVAKYAKLYLISKPTKKTMTIKDKAPEIRAGIIGDLKSGHPRLKKILDWYYPDIKPTGNGFDINKLSAKELTEFKKTQIYKLLY